MPRDPLTWPLLATVALLIAGVGWHAWRAYRQNRQRARSTGETAKARLRATIADYNQAGKR